LRTHCQVGTNPEKRALFEKPATDLRSSARDIAIALASQKESGD
jgi:hypothetical protein